MSIDGAISASLAIGSATTGNYSNSSAAAINAATAANAGSGSASTSSGDKTSTVTYPDGSTVTTVRTSQGQVVSVTVTEPAATAPRATASSGIDVSA